MDAVKFFEELRRMCDDHKDNCIGCPLYDDAICFARSFKKGCNEEIVLHVEKWSAEHPKKTRLQDFMEKHPNAPLYEYDEGEFPMTFPSVLGYCGNKSSFPCGDCPYDTEPETFCWNLPLEE